MVGVKRGCDPVPGPPPFGSSWVKRYCTFVKEQKILHMMTYDPKSGGKCVSDRHLNAFPEAHSFIFTFHHDVMVHLISCVHAVRVKTSLLH